MVDKVYDDIVVVPFEEAVKMLPDGEDVHTFMKSGFPGMMIGASWSKNSVVEALKENEVQLSGKIAAEAGHKLVIREYPTSLGRYTALFIETKE